MVFPGEFQNKKKDTMIYKAVNLGCKANTHGKCACYFTKCKKPPFLYIYDINFLLQFCFKTTKRVGPKQT